MDLRGTIAIRRVGPYSGAHTITLNITDSLLSDSGRQSEEIKKLFKTQTRTKKANNFFAV